MTTSSTAKTNAAIGVDHEYGNLKEVIVGIGETRYPNVEKAAWASEGLKVLPEAEAEKVRSRSGARAQESSKFDELKAENDELISILEQFGVTVHRPSIITDEQITANYGAEWLVNGHTQVYSRDPMFVVGDNVIELSPSAPNRRAEMLGYRELFGNRVV